MKKHFNYYKLIHPTRKKSEFIIEEELCSWHKSGTRLKLTNSCKEEITIWVKYSRGRGVLPTTMPFITSTRYKNIDKLDELLKIYIDKKGYEIVSNRHPYEVLEELDNNLNKLETILK